MKTVPLSPLVEDRLIALFASEEQDEARKMLVEECGENVPLWKSAGLDRLRCACLKLSDGQIWKLRRAVDLAKKDFRDALMAADFGNLQSYLTWVPEKRS